MSKERNDGSPDNGQPAGGCPHARGAGAGSSSQTTQDECPRSVDDSQPPSPEAAKCPHTAIVDAGSPAPIIGEGKCPHTGNSTSEAAQYPGESDPDYIARQLGRSEAFRAEHAIDPDRPQIGDGGPWRPKNTHVGFSALKYVVVTACYWVLQTLNRKLSRNPYNKVSWDKWPSHIGLLYLAAKLYWLRCHALSDPYDYAANDTKRFDYEPEEALHEVDPTGAFVADDGNPQAAGRLTRYGHNETPRKVRPDPENIRPSSRDVGKLRWRMIDTVTGKEIYHPALIMNVLGQAHIQEEFHGFGGDTLRDSVCQNPHILKRDGKDGWPANVALVDRTTVDPTRVNKDARVTELNKMAHAWIQGQVYGVTLEQQNSLRGEGGYMRLDRNGLLPEDPHKPGIDLVGFNNNYNPGLSLLQWLKVKDHNAIVDHLRYFHPDWSDEKLFQQAKRTNIAEIARIHTIIWTEDLLQHPTLMLGMHTDWYGLLGQRKKMYLMRFGGRHPIIHKLLTPIRHTQFIWGMPGGSWDEQDGPHQVPLQFRPVYRLHDMILSEFEIIEPETDRMLDRIKLIDFIHTNTRPIVEKYAYDVLAYSFVKASCGALVLHNVPRAMTQMGFENMTDGQLTDIAERDTFRERVAGTGTYNEFRRSVGEPAVESFMELTGGNAELAREIEIMYDGDINKVDLGIGILAEPKPAGFALSYTQFYEFIKDATRRITCNRHLTEAYTYAEYEEGMDWIEHSGGTLGMLARHLPRLKPQMEGVLRPYAPWPSVEEFPRRLRDIAHSDTGKVFLADLRTFVVALVAAGAAVLFGANVPLITVLLVLGFVAPLLLVGKRELALRFMELCEKKCRTDKRGFMFGTLYKAEKWIERAAAYGRWQALAIMALAGTIEYQIFDMHPLIAMLFGAVTLSAMSIKSRSKTFAANAQVLKVALRNRMREGQPVTDARSLPGRTALQKRYWFLIDKTRKGPVATLDSCYEALLASGEPIWTAYGTSLLSCVLFGLKTQKGLSLVQRWKAGIRSPFDIYLPNIHQAFGDSSTRIYARPGNEQGLAPGEIDFKEFEYQSRRYSPGRDHFTAYDFARMREGNHVRASREAWNSGIIIGKFRWFFGIPKRFLGRMALKRRHDQLMPLFADRVVEEDRSFVPAISHEMMIRIYDGSAQHDLLREHREGDLDPSPTPKPTSLKQLAAKASSHELTELYTKSQVTSIPNGDSRGKAFVLPGTILGKVLSLLANGMWKGKVLNKGTGTLVNKILGMRVIRAELYIGRSWFDGRESIIIDYLRTSWVAFFIRDEIRMVQPGLYLGKAYVRLPFGLRFCLLDFALDFRK